MTFRVQPTQKVKTAIKRDQIQEDNENQPQNWICNFISAKLPSFNRDQGKVINNKKFSNVIRSALKIHI